MYRVLRAGSISNHGMRILSSFSETSPVFKEFKGGLGEKNASKVLSPRSPSLVAKCGLYLQSHFHTSVEVKNLYEDDHAADSIAREDGPNDGDVLLNCVKLNGMPYEATPEDVTKFFHDLSASIKGIFIMRDAKTERPNGVCYVHLADEDSAVEAVRSLRKAKMGLRYIEMTCHSNYEAKYYIDKYVFKAFSTDLTEGMRNLTPYTIIRARGLPFSVKMPDILNFFADFNVRSTNIELIHKSGKFTGIALVGFPSREEADKAITALCNKYIGTRYIELKY